MQARASHLDDQARQTQRRTMVDRQIRTFDVTDQRVLERFLSVPREQFVPDDMRPLAYSDIGIVIDLGGASGETRYLLPPMVLARLLQGGRIRPTDRVLDIGGGYGYSTAILYGLAAAVTALETELAFRDAAMARLAAAGLGLIKTIVGDLAEGAASDGPFDVIVINGAVAAHLEALFAQLADGGRLLAIWRSADAPLNASGRAACFEKRGGEIGRRYLFDAAAPLLAAFRKAPAFVF